MSSIGSATSTVISYGGEEVELETALDDLYKSIQHNLNHSQCAVREMSKLKEDDLFMDCVPIHWAVCDYVDILNDLFKQLLDISSQVLGKPNKDEKEEYKKICEERKIRKKREKEQAKQEAKQAKEKELKEQEKLKTIKE